MKPHQRGERTSKRKALTTITICAVILAGLIWWQWEPITTIAYLIGFALA